LGDYLVVHAAEEQTRQLKQALITRAPIEQAKGILMAVHQITAAEAFEMLRQLSQYSNTKLNQVAADFVTAQSAHPTGAQNQIPADGQAVSPDADLTDR
jgi:AmiR/NasT family two-component response regulator